MKTDGASAMLLMSEEKALELGYKPKAYLRCVPSADALASLVLQSCVSLWLWDKLWDGGLS